MMISALASRDKDTAEREQEHQTVYSHTANTSHHTLLDKNKDPARYYGSSIVLETFVQVWNSLKDKINKLQSNSKSKSIRDLYRG
jgi:hypothetical protein